MKISNRSKSLLSLAKRSPLEPFSNYYCSRPLSKEISLSEVSMAYVAIDRSYKALG